ncbi:MAG: helix-turn-helix domain-containing protein [Kiritimatiellae bacterium]|nr:helix-turn-helix domain-containing protein [Kiritimatiellia bacterium]
MNHRTRYTKKTIPPKRVAEMQRKFMKAAGPAMQLLVDLMENTPNLSLIVKNAEGRIMFTNRYNASVSGWRSVDDMLGYTSEELYPPDQAAVYANRDRDVMESGVPIIERVYGFVADRSTNLNCVTVRPIDAIDGKRIGTATVYWRAQQIMQTANWYDPIRRAVVHLNEHYAENVTVDKLAKIAHYSPAQFRRLFRELTQMSPSDYITSVRVNAAKTLLGTTDRRISDIASDIGFFDHAHFIRTFKRVVGTTPAKYRKGLSRPAQKI